MKKISVVLFIVVAISMAFAACAPAATPTAVPTKAAEPTKAAPTSVPTTAPTKAAEPTKAPAAAEPTKAAAADATAAPTASAEEKVPPMPGSSPYTKDKDSDALVAAFAAKLVFTTIDYEAFNVDPKTTLDDVIAYYDTKATAAGWTGEGGKAKETVNGEGYAIYKNAQQGTILVVSLIKSEDGSKSYSVAIIGNKPQ